MTLKTSWLLPGRRHKRFNARKCLSTSSGVVSYVYRNAFCLGNIALTYTGLVSACRPHRATRYSCRAKDDRRPERTHSSDSFLLLGINRSVCPVPGVPGAPSGLRTFHVRPRTVPRLFSVRHAQCGRVPQLPLSYSYDKEKRRSIGAHPMQTSTITLYLYYRSLCTGGPSNSTTSATKKELGNAFPFFRFEWLLLEIYQR